MKWMNIIKNPKMPCPMCGERSFGIDIQAKGREKNIMRCSECGYKQDRRR